MKNPIASIAITLLLAISSLPAATHYVWLVSTNPTPPYSNWITAATNIQDAVDVAATNDVVLVTNGVYPGYVSVTIPLTLRSVNGPQFTIINGGGTNQCVCLADSASLTGFTLTNGYTEDWGGGVACASPNAFLTNCWMVGNSAVVGGGVSGGTLYNCTLSGNSAGDGEGGGAYSCALYSCTLTGNSAGVGGGASGGTLHNCTLSGNSAGDGEGGGAYSCALYNCTLTGNSAVVGGGASGGTLCNCTLTGNSADPTLDGDGGVGGGANGCTLDNCTLSGNSAGGGEGAGRTIAPSTTASPTTTRRQEEQITTPPAPLTTVPPRPSPAPGSATLRWTRNWPAPAI